MNTVCCPSCGEFQLNAADYCALCGAQITSPEPVAVYLHNAPTQTPYATIEVQNPDDDDMSSPTITYYPVDQQYSRFQTPKSPFFQRPFAQRLSDARLPKTDPPIWGDDDDDGTEKAVGHLSEGQFYEGTWHKELNAPSLHLHSLPAPRPSSPHPVVLLKPRIPRRQERHSPVLLFWISVLVLFVLVLAGFFGLATSMGRGLFGNTGGGIPTLQLSATTLAVGEALTLHGTHFTPGGRVGLTRDNSIALNDTHGTNVLKADAQGSFSDSIVAVSDWQPGFHTVSAEDAVLHQIARVSLLITGTSGSLRPAHFRLSANSLNMGIGDSATNTEKTMTLTNIGGGQLTWNGTSSQPWLLLTPPSGTLDSGQNAPVTIAVDRTGIAPGNYTGQVLFSSDAGNAVVSITMQVIPLNVQNDAVLALNPAILSFTATDGASAPKAENVTLSNQGAKTLQWSVSSNQSWLSASPGSGSVAGISSVHPSSLAGATGQSAQGDITQLGVIEANPGQAVPGGLSQAVSVSVNTSSMLPGTYTGILTFNAYEQQGQVTGGIQSIAVSLTVQPQCSIQVAPSLVSFAAVYQQTAPTAKPINVAGTQECTTPLKWSVTSSASWLNVNSSSGTTPSNPQVSVNSAGLAPGTYTSALVFTTSSGTQTLPVSLIVGQSASPAISVNVPVLNYSATVGSTSPVSQVATISNSGGSSLSWQASAVTAIGGNWLSVSPTSGTLAANQSGTVSIGATLLNTLVPGTYTGTVTITGTDSAGNIVAGSPQLIQVNFVVSAPCGVTALPSTLTFTGVSGQAAITPQPVTLTASGACANPLTWSAVSSSSWLVPATTTGSFSLTTAGTISVGASLTGLVPGTYPATLTVTTTNSVTNAAVGVPLKIPATLIVQSPCTLSPSSQPTLTFTAEAGQSAATQSFSVGVSGYCVGNVTITPTVTLSAGTGWLTVSPASASIAAGTSTTFSVSFSAASLQAGSYTASISLSGMNGSASIAGSPQIVGVNVTVTMPPVLAASAGTISIHSSNGVISQPVVITNTGGNTLNWTATAGSNTPSFLSLSNTTGTLAAGVNTQISMAANTTAITAGTYTISITVTATEAISGAAVNGSPTTVNVQVTVSPPSLQVSTNNLSYSAIAGSNPTAKTVTITNGGGGTLTWSIGSFSSTWLSVDTTSGSDAASISTTVTFSANAASLTAGSYTETAVITPSVGSPFTITATLAVSAPPTPTPTPTTAPTPTPTAGITPTATATVGITPTATAEITPTSSATAGAIASTTLDTTTEASLAIPPLKPIIS